jgi:Ca2+-binding EF-hand superfamily protein
MKRTVQHGELESACGFRDANKYNTKMETEMGTECDFRQQHAQLRNSISYKPIPYRGANGVLVLNGLRGHDAEAAATTNGKVEVQPIMAQKEDTDTYLTLIKEQDVKIKLTNAINKVLKLDSSSKIQNGHAVHSLDMDGLELAPPTKYLTIRNLWKRRHARTIEEGIRRERIEPTTTEQLLSTVLDETTQSEDGAVDGKGPKKKQRFAARTIAGLISALAEEATGLEVEVDARNDTPFWGKQIDAVKINFSRLGVKALRMGGLDEALRDVGEDLAPNEKESMADSLRQKAEQMYNDSDFGEGFAVNNSIDEVFDRIDVDNSGALDEKELAGALSIASGLSADDESDTSAEALSKLASKLVSIYDVNGDGVVDRKEYRKLVEDMAAVRDAQRTKERDREEKRQESLEKKGGIHPLKWAKIAGTLIPRWASKDSHTVNNQEREITSASSIEKKSNIQGKDLFDSTNSQERDGVDFAGARDISNDSSFIDTISKGEGSIVFTDLKLDLRRLLFGAVPLLKRVSIPRAFVEPMVIHSLTHDYFLQITPGGPLILEPFTTTFKGSFSKEDILESGLLDDGLRRLVARALRRRVRSLRDLLDGAVFYGRTWNTASKQAPVVEVQKLTNIEFDSQDRMIITGRAKIRTSPDQPSVENSFKLRTRLGTRENGRYIRLEDPELALVLECPKAWERK